MKYDFSGYATKNDLKCSDGRTIKKDAFKHHDGLTVPLVWQHMHNEPSNILGHAILEHRDDGVYTYALFNDTDAGKNAKQLVLHGDIKALSIFANGLVQKAQDVMHGFIKEVSLVLSGANPGALIDNVSIAHGDGSYVDDLTEAVIYTDSILSLEDLEHAESSDKTMKEVFDTLDDEQKDVVYAMIAHAVGEADEGTEGADGTKIIKHTGGKKVMKKNVFDKTQMKAKEKKTTTLTHAQFGEIMANATKTGSLKEAVMMHAEANSTTLNELIHAGTYGIDNIDVLFPDAKLARGGAPEFDKRRSEWVNDVLSAIHKTPFAKIKSMYADITADEARAKGYITGAEKFEEVFPLFKRTTEPTTIYKKQKLDRDDIIDITDLNVVSWLKMEMRLMLDEERAKAYLIGDGRAFDHQDKINEAKIRPIYTDDAIYSAKVQLANDVSLLDEVEAVIRARKQYKGSGTPNFYTTADKVTDWLLLKNTTTGEYRFRTIDELTKKLRVKKIVEVEVMENVSRDVTGTEHDLIGIMVNLRDYTSGADKGGQVSMFDDFDIDFNQHKYLIETRCSGALTKIRSAVVVEKAQAAG